MVPQLTWLGFACVATACAATPPPKVAYTVDYPGVVHEDVEFTPYENGWASNQVGTVDGAERSWTGRCSLWQRKQKFDRTDGSSVAQRHFIDLQVKGTCGLADAEQKDASASHARKDDEARKQAEERRARLQGVAADEIKSGRCTDARAGTFQGGLVQVKQYLDASDMGVFVIEDSKILVAASTGTGFTLSPSATGETHVFAISSLAVKLDVRDASGYPVTAQSTLQAVVAMTGAETDGRVLMVNPGAQVTGRVLGQGCTAVFIVHRL